MKHFLMGVCALVINTLIIAWVTIDHANPVLVYAGFITGVLFCIFTACTFAIFLSKPASQGWH